MFTNLLAAKQTDPGYRWVMLALCTLTPLLVVTLPNMSLPPMFVTIGEDLNLSLVQIGIIWGMAPFTGVFFALIGGTMGDRFGTRTMLVMACLLTGLFGITRSCVMDFYALLFTTLALGVFQVIVPVLIFKVARQWFPVEQLGMASGVIAAGFAGGLMLGPLLSTSLILPAFGGWRQVLLFYGAIAIAISLAWLVIHPPEQRSDAGRKPGVPLGESLRHVVRLRNIWIIGLGGLGINACFQGFTGYLPTYLKTIGWTDLAADRALAAFFVTSLLAVVPLSILSDRLRLRRGFLIWSALILSLGIGALGVVEGALIVLVIAATGTVYDAFMAIFNASILEADGVSHVYAGTALGFAMMLRNAGGTFSPPLGNSLSDIGANIPFLFWGAMGLFGVFMFVFLHDSKKTAVPESQVVIAGDY